MSKELHSFSVPLQPVETRRHAHRDAIACYFNDLFSPKCMRRFLNSYCILWMAIGIFSATVGIKNLRFDVFVFIAPNSIIHFAAIINLVTGVIIFITALSAHIFLMLRSRYIFVLLATILTFTGVVFLILYSITKDSAPKEMQIMRSRIIETWSKKNNSEIGRIFKLFQEELQCCGIFSWRDWKEIPESCCELELTPCPESFVYKENCADKATAYVESNVFLMKLTVIATAVVEILSLCLFLCLTYPYHNREENVESITDED